MEQNSSNATYYPLDFRLIATTIHSLIAIVGLIGNFMVITVVLRVRGMMTPTNCYLFSLAASDCLFFISAMPIELTSFHVPMGVYLFGTVACKIFTFLPYLAINAGSLAIAAFTVERYIGICHPMRAKYICTVRRAKFIISVLWLFSIFYNSPWLVLTDLEPWGYADWPDAKRCSYKLQRDYKLYKVQYLVDFTVFYFLPLLLYLVLYGRTAKILMQAKFGKNTLLPMPRSPAPTKKNSCRATKVSGTSDNSTLLGVAATPPMSRCSTPVNSGGGSVGRDSNVAGAVVARSRYQVVRMLVVIVVVFALCWLPYRGLVVYNSFVSMPFLNRWYIFFAKTMIFFNSAVNPILYSILSVKFRRAFRILLKTSCLRGKHRYGYNLSTLQPIIVASSAAMMTAKATNGSSPSCPQTPQKGGTFPYENQSKTLNSKD